MSTDVLGDKCNGGAGARGRGIMCSWASRWTKEEKPLTCREALNSWYKSASSADSANRCPKRRKEQTTNSKTQMAQNQECELKYVKARFEKVGEKLSATMPYSSMCDGCVGAQLKTCMFHHKTWKKCKKTRTLKLQFITHCLAFAQKGAKMMALTRLNRKLESHQ